MAPAILLTVWLPETRTFVKKIVLDPHIPGDYVSLIYAGLYELQAGGKVSIEFAKASTTTLSIAKQSHAVLSLTVEDTELGTAKRIGFDFIDGGAIASPDLLANVDVYYKRSFQKSEISQLSQELARRVKPFGLHYACVSPRERVADRWRSRQVYNRWLSQGRAGPANVASIKTAFRSTASLVLSKHTRSRSRLPLTPTAPELEGLPHSAAEPEIYYRTRVYRPKTRSQHRGVAENEQRVAVIRALKKAFGKRFVGGLRDSGFARSRYPDCLFSADINWRQHIQLVHQNLIGVTTAGLFGSTDWKVPEYLAASRCVVSEKLRYDLEQPLKEGREVLSFATPDECVESCELILTDPTLAESMRANAHRYYREHLAPVRVLERVLACS